MRKRGDVRRPAPSTTELLAPAGSLEAFFAALENGADAVYCGLQEFSARAKAKNFSLAEAARMCAFAHQQGRRLYVTLNTLLKESELPRMIEILAALEEMGADGIIIQDPGLWRLARRHFPGLPLHASTQMTIHNGAGVRMLEEMGFSRAVLARELSLAEIGQIRRQSSMELEHFVHGALCFSISGQCFFSSAISGMSGNRGRCAQPCRRRYRLQEQPGYHFSTSDLCALELLPQLIEAGVISFKIEGRMKSAEYVARVVAAYRLVLDAPANGRKQALQEAAEQLELSFGRQPTKGFLSGFLPTSLGDSRRQGALGRQLGKVTTLRSGRVGLAVAERLHVGDRIRIQPQNDQVGSGFTVREIVLDGKKVKAARAGDFVQVPIPPKAGFFKAGDAVFKVGGKIAFLLSPESCREKLAQVEIKPPPPTRREELARRREQALAELIANREAVKPLPPAAVSNRMAREVSGHRVPSPVLIAAANLKAMPIGGRVEISPLPEPARSPQDAGPGERFGLTVRGRGLADLALLAEPQVDRLELPLSPENLTALPKAEARLGRGRERLIWEIPPLLFGEEWNEYRRAIQILTGRGYLNFRVGNPGHLPLFAGLAGVKLLGSFRCYTMNHQAALAWQELGLSELTLNLEDDRENIKALLRHPLPLTLPLTLTVTVYGPLPILISRIPIKVRPGSLLRSDQEDGYRVHAAHGLTEVTAEKDLSLSGLLGQIRAMGCTSMLADLSHCGAVSPKGRRVLAALAADQPLPETTLFNYSRGLT